MGVSYYIQLFIAGISNGAMYAVIAVGWALIFSVLKFSNFGHGGVMVCGAYIGMFISKALHLNLWLTLIFAATCGGLINILVEIVCFHRLRKSAKVGALFFVASITMGILLQNIIAINFSGTYYAYPSFFANRFRTIGSISFDIANLVMLGVSAGAILILVIVLKYTRLGISIRALSMDERTTGLMGVNVNKVVLATFFVAGALAGIAGVFVGIRTSLTPQIGSVYIIKGFMVCVIGGLGSMNGALFAALILGLVETACGVIFGTSLTPVGTFIFMLIFMLIRPQGLAGNFSSQKA